MVKEEVNWSWDETELLQLVGEKYDNNEGFAEPVQIGKGFYCTTICSPNWFSYVYFTC